MTLKRFICLCLYYGIARWLPVSHSRWSFQIGKYVRRGLCRHIFKKMGRGVNIERGAFFGTGSEIEIGDRSGLGINCRIHPNTKIGCVVMMGPNCIMLEADSHIYIRTDISMIDQGKKPVSERCQVVIEDDIWIGQDVMILGSKIIKTGTIIGARCVLTKNFPDYSIVGGNPSRLIRNRK